MNTVREVFEQIAQGDLHAWPRGYFVGEDGEGRLKTVFELVCEREQIELKGLGIKTLQKYRLVSHITNSYDGSIHAVINKFWPGRYETWELANVPRGYWKGEKGRENAARAIQWLAKKLNVRIRDLVAEDYRENGLAGMLTAVFGSSTLLAAEYMEKGEKKVEYPETEERLIFPSSDRSMTPVEVANRLNVHPSYIRREITAGKLLAVDLNFGSGRSPRYRISEQDLQTYLAERRVPRKSRSNNETNSES